MPDAPYRILYNRSVEKDLRGLSVALRKAIVKKILALATDPLPAKITKLRGLTDLYRLRHSGYRIIYKFQKGQLYILIIKVGHRQKVYKEL